jgi:hypothetical protein
MTRADITHHGPSEAARERVLTRDAVAFLADLHARFGTQRGCRPSCSRAVARNSAPWTPTSRGG